LINKIINNDLEPHLLGPIDCMAVKCLDITKPHFDKQNLLEKISAKIIFVYSKKTFTKRKIDQHSLGAHARSK